MNKSHANSELATKFLSWIDATQELVSELRSLLGAAKTQPKEKVRQTQPARLGKSDRRYWLARVEKPTFRDKDGVTKESRHYAVAMSHGGKRKHLSLHTASASTAAERACRLWTNLKLLGSWEAALSKLRSNDQEKS